MPRIPARTVSQFIAEQLPDAVRENYQPIVDFLTAYYSFLEQDGQLYQRAGILKDQRDIDRSLDAFLDHFSNEFLNSIPRNILADKRKLVKYSKQFYQSKGSENSFRLLFRLLYGDDISFYYPKNDMLKVSDGKWQIDTVIRTTTANDTGQFVNRQIIGASSNATAAVEGVVQFLSNGAVVSELKISNLNGTFQIGEQISCSFGGNTFHETVYGIVGKVVVTRPGTNYSPDDPIGLNGGGGTGAQAVVDKVGGFDTGRVVSAAAASATSGAKIVLAASASNIDGFYNGMKLTLTDGTGAGQTVTVTSYTANATFDTQTQTWVNGIHPHTAVVDADWTVVPDVTTHYSIALGQIKTVKINDFGIGYTSAPVLDFSISGNGDAAGTAQVASVATYPGYYLNTDGFLSDTKKIQDDVFYQDFSYVIRATESLSAYRDIVKKLLHPAGMAMFGEVDIATQLLAGTTWKTLERNKFRYPPYEGFSETFLVPNQNYWSAGFGNSQISGYGNTLLSDPISNSAGKQNQVADAYISTGLRVDAIPTQDLVAEYDFVPGANAQLLYDRQPTGNNGVLGEKSGADFFDPVYISMGLHFMNFQYVRLPVPVNLLNQTIMIVFAPDNLNSRNQSVMGCIDAPFSSSGYNIRFGNNGALQCMVNKIATGFANPFTVAASPHFVSDRNNRTQIKAGTFVATTLRYSTNRITATINNDLINQRWSTYFPTDVDNTVPVLNNSHGYVIGNLGRVTHFSLSPYFGSSYFGVSPLIGRTNKVVSLANGLSLWGVTQWGTHEWGGDNSTGLQSGIPSGVSSSFNGTVAYALIWQRAISDDELVQAYLYVRDRLKFRGISLP